MEKILRILPTRYREEIRDKNLRFEALQEIRMRVGQPLVLRYQSKELLCHLSQPVEERDIKELLEYVSQYSMYAYQEQLCQGYLTIQGGHRIGVAGKTVVKEGIVTGMLHISSINIRVAHEVIGCSSDFLPMLMESGRYVTTMILSPPGYGKTTLLRDMVRQISDQTNFSIGVVDERSELASCHRGIPQLHVGMRTDVLDGCPKAEGMLMLLRSMSPEIIAVDEIGTSKDATAIQRMATCGCTLFATVHGTSREDVLQKPILGRLLKEGIFRRFLVPKTGAAPYAWEVQDEMGRRLEGTG